MTTPNQVVGNVFGSIEHDLAAFIGQGAYQVGNAAQNWGQHVTEEFVRVLTLGPGAIVADAFSSIEGFLAALEQFLLQLPLEALQMFRRYIPGALEAAFETIEGAVLAIMGFFNGNGALVYLKDLQNWLTGVYIILETEVHQILDAIQGLLVTPITSRVTGFVDWLTSLQTFQTGTTNAVGGLADGLASLLAGIPQTGATLESSVAGALSQFGGMLNQIQQGVTGAANQGQQASAGLIHDVLADLNGAVSGAQAQMAQVLGWLAPRPPAVVVGGSAPTPVEVPIGWGTDWTVTGTAAADATVVTKGWSLVKEGHAARRLLGINNTEDTQTDYQSVRFLLASNIETPLAGGGDQAGNGLIFRCDSDTNPQHYGELRLYYNRIELWVYNAGVQTLLHTWTVATTWGSTYSLDCGTANGLNHYQLRSNGVPVGDEYVDSGNLISTGAGFRKGGQSMYTDNRGGTTETGPGVISYWKLSDNPPTQKVGSGFKVCRVNTTGMNFPLGTSGFPPNFYDTVDRITPDYQWDAAGSKITVRDEGPYTFTIALPFLASNGTYNTSGNAWLVGIAVDGVIDAFGGTTSTTDTGVFWTSPPTYCQAGSEVVPVYSTSTAKTISGGYGTQTAFERTTQYFAGAKLGQVVV